MNPSTTFTADLERAMRKDLPYQLVVNTTNRTLEVHADSVWSKWKGRKVYSITEKLDRFTTLLRHLPKAASPSDADQSKLLELAANFARRNLKKLPSDSVKAAEFTRRLWAHRLAIPYEALTRSENSGFLAYAQSAHLHRYLAGNDDQLEVHKGTIHMLYEGRYRKWSEIQKACTEFNIPSENYYSRYQLGSDRPLRGIHKESRTEFTELYPVAYDPTKEEGTFHIEIVDWTAETPKLKGVHEYLRLWKGPWAYIPGIYRPNKRGKELFQNPAMTRPGTWHSKDWTEESRVHGPWNARTLLMEVESEEQIDAILKDIERQQAERYVPYTITHSCVGRTNELLKLANLHLNLPSKESTIRILFYHYKEMFSTQADKWVSDRVHAVAGAIFFAIGKGIKFVWRLLPFPLRFLLREAPQVPIGIVMNIYFATIGGACALHPDLSEYEPAKWSWTQIKEFLTIGIQPSCQVTGPVRAINSIWGIFNYRMGLMIESPTHRGLHVFPSIEQWREEIGEPLAVPNSRWEEWERANHHRFDRDCLV